MSEKNEQRLYVALYIAAIACFLLSIVWERLHRPEVHPLDYYLGEPVKAGTMGTGSYAETVEWRTIRPAKKSAGETP